MRNDHDGLPSLRGQGRKRTRTDGDVAEQSAELTDTGRQRALGETITELHEAAAVLNEVAKDVSEIHTSPGQQPKSDEAAMDKKVLEHVLNCPASKGYTQLRTVGIICTLVISSFIGLFLYLAPGSFENAVSKGVEKAWAKKLPELKQYIDQQLIITHYQMPQHSPPAPPEGLTHSVPRNSP